MIPEWPGEADTARLILAIEAHEPQDWRQRVAGWWWTAWDATWGRVRRTLTRDRWRHDQACPDDYARTVEACLLDTERRLVTARVDLVHVKAEADLLWAALVDTTHSYEDPGGGDSGCEWETPAGERMVPGQVCGQSEWHPAHRTPGVVLDGAR